MVVPRTKLCQHLSVLISSMSFPMYLALLKFVYLNHCLFSFSMLVFSVSLDDKKDLRPVKSVWLALHAELKASFCPSIGKDIKQKWYYDIVSRL